MRVILRPFRFVAIFLAILAFLGTMSLVWFVVRSRWSRVRLSNRILQSFTRLGLWILKVKVTLIGIEYLKESGLLVGNHLSYLDVLVISSRVPACFVTSQEIRETPFLGQICQMAGCLFVERRNKHNLRAEISELSKGLTQRLNVAVFPEATSTNGEQILRFRRPLFMAAVDASRPVIPFCLNYRRVGGKPINLVTRDSVFWYGDMEFAPHLWALCGSGGVEVDLHFLPPKLTQAQSETAQLAEWAHEAVVSVFLPVKKDEDRLASQPS